MQAEVPVEEEKAIDEVCEQAMTDVEGMSEAEMDAVIAEELERLQN